MVKVKVKLFLYMLHRHMRQCIYSLNQSSPQHYMKMSGFTHWPGYTLEKSPQYPLNRRLGGPQSQSGHFKLLYLFPNSESNQASSDIQPVAQSLYKLCYPCSLKAEIRNGMCLPVKTCSCSCVLNILLLSNAGCTTGNMVGIASSFNLLLNELMNCSSMKWSEHTVRLNSTLSMRSSRLQRVIH